MALERVSQQAIDKFKRIAKYDVKKLLIDFTNFAQSGALDLYSYYNGDSGAYPTVAYNELIRLQREMVGATEKFRINANSFILYDFWVLLEMVEDAISRLDTIANYSVWTRSPILNGLVGKSSEIDHVIKSGQTLEEISADVQGDVDPQNQWVDIAIRNSLNEEAYDTNGGVILKVNFGNNVNSLSLNAVVDNINTAEKTYGLDIDRTLTYTDNDLKTLSYNGTIQQAADILGGLKKDDNPFHPNDGLDVKTVLGNSLAAISFPIIFRQLVQTFSKDDTFASISILDITRSKDGVWLEYEVVTKAGEVLEQGVLI
jgi:hypothetical protein